MSTLTVSGKTIEEAIQKGLTELKVTKEQVTVRVIEEPSRGFFGLIGARPAKVELVLKQSASESAPRVTEERVKVSSITETVASSAVLDAGKVHEAADSLEHRSLDIQEAKDGKNVTSALQEAQQFVAEVARTMGLNVDVTVNKKRDHYLFDIAGEDLGLIIGRRGQTLDSLQYLTNLVANRYSDQHLRIILDAEQFRDRRRQTLESLAERLANKVIRTRKEVVLEPMSPQERKIIHAKLQDHSKVKTYSKGEEPNRRIVITLK